MFDTEDPGKPDRVTFTSSRHVDRFDAASVAASVDRCRARPAPPRSRVTPNVWLASSLHR
jgi:hypothetical protein